MSTQSLGLIAVPDALDAMERNLRLLIELAGRRPGQVEARLDAYSGTASMVHSIDHAGRVSCVVMFPALPAATRITKAEADRWTAYFLHEVSHALYTDERTWQKAIGEELHNIVNGLEDVRIERLLIKSAVSDNAQALLTELVNFCANRLPPDYDPNDGEQLPWTLAYFGRALVNGYDMPKATKDMSKLTGAARVAIMRALDKLRDAKSTLDCLKIARELCGRNPETGAQEQQQEQAKTQSGEGESNPQDETGQGETQSQGANSDANPETQTGERNQNDSGDGAGGSGAGGSLDGSPKVFDATQAQEIDMTPLSQKSRVTNKGMTAHERHDAASLAEIIRRISSSPYFKVKDANPYMASGVNKVSESLVKGARRAAKLRQQAARVLKSVDDVAWSRNQARGRLDRFAFTRIGAGETNNVFSRRFEESGVETEIILLLDGSGSMGGSSGRGISAKSRAAGTFVLALAQAADQVGVACEVLQFNSSGLEKIKAQRERISSKEATKRLAGCIMSNGGGTPLTDCIVLSAQRLAARAFNKRRIIFAITDGGCDRGPQAIRAAATYAASLGVEIVGLSLDTNIQGAFTHEVSVSSREDVARAGFGALLTVLENKKAA